MGRFSIQPDRPELFAETGRLWPFKLAPGMLPDWSRVKQFAGVPEHVVRIEVCEADKVSPAA